jgi:hypothetical protein
MASAATTPNQGPGDRTTLPYAVSHATQENDPNVLAGVSDVKQPGKGAPISASSGEACLRLRDPAVWDRVCDQARR